MTYKWSAATELLQSQYILYYLMKLWSLNLLTIACHYRISLLVTLQHMLLSPEKTKTFVCLCVGILAVICLM